ncbi:winged helix DNA-binding protein [bacterium]|nr:winged helix DNA-binding protein [bacterium]
MPHQIFDLIQSIKKGCVRTEEHLRRECGLSTAEFNGILIIDPEEHVFGGEFSERMDLSPSRGSRVINQLVKKDLFQTEPVPENRRAIRVFFTDSGKKIRAMLDTEIEECEKRLLLRLPESQRESFRETLETLAFLLNNPL